MKHRTWKKSVKIVSLKSSLPRPLRAFFIVFSWIRKSKGLVTRSVNPMPINQSINPMFKFKLLAYYRKTNKKKLNKDTAGRKVYISFT